MGTVLALSVFGSASTHAMFGEHAELKLAAMCALGAGLGRGFHMQRHRGTEPDAGVLLHVFKRNRDR